MLKQTVIWLARNLIVKTLTLCPIETACVQVSRSLSVSNDDRRFDNGYKMLMHHKI